MKEDYTSSSTDLEQIAQKLKLPLIGVYSKDNLPDRLYVGSFIINMENSDVGNGSHWVLLKVFPTKEVIYFDSFGLSPPQQIKDFVKGKIATSTRQIQDIDATTCGYYCLAADDYMTYQKQHRPIFERYDDFLNIFVADTKKNDEILLDYLSQMDVKL
jgi:hypothetical protein